MLEQVVLPYLKSKLHSIYNREREARLQATLWGDETEHDYSPVSVPTSDAGAPVTTRVTKRVQRILGFCYPWLHASAEGMSNSNTGYSELGLAVYINLIFKISIFFPPRLCYASCLSQLINSLVSEYP